MLPDSSKTKWGTEQQSVLRLIDLTKAFDAVRREDLLRIRAKYGCPWKSFIIIITFTRHFHYGPGIQAIVQDNTETSVPFPVPNKEKLYCVLARILFPPRVLNEADICVQRLRCRRWHQVGHSSTSGGSKQKPTSQHHQYLPVCWCQRSHRCLWSGHAAQRWHVLWCLHYFRLTIRTTKTKVKLKKTSPTCLRLSPASPSLGKTQHIGHVHTSLQYTSPCTCHWWWGQHQTRKSKCNHRQTPQECVRQKRYYHTDIDLQIISAHYPAAWLQDTDGFPAPCHGAATLHTTWQDLLAQSTKTRHQTQKSSLLSIVPLSIPSWCRPSCAGQAMQFACQPIDSARRPSFLTPRWQTPLWRPEESLPEHSQGSSESPQHQQQLVEARNCGQNLCASVAHEVK